MQIINANTSPEALISALAVAETRLEAHAEIWRRLQAGNKANRLVVEFLLDPHKTIRHRNKFSTSEDEFSTSEDESSTDEDEFSTSEDESSTDEDEFSTSEDESSTSEDESSTSENEFSTDALEGLISICWVALKKIRIGGSLDAYGERRHEVEVETRDFIRYRIAAELKEFSGRTKQEVLFAGLNEKFKYLPKHIHNAAVDYVRRVMAKREAKSQGWKSVPPGNYAYRVGAMPALGGDRDEGCPYDRVTGEREPVTTRSVTDQRIIDHIAPEDLLEEIKRHQNELKSSMTEVQFECLKIMAEGVIADESDSKRIQKSLFTEAIAAARGVSREQARKDKRGLVIALGKSGSLGRRFLNALVHSQRIVPWRWPWVPVGGIGLAEMEGLAEGSPYQRERIKEYRSLTLKNLQKLLTERRVWGSVSKLTGEKVE